MNLNQLITTGFMGLISAVAIWGGTKLEKISDNLAELKTTVATVATKQTWQDSINSDLNERIKELEKRRR